MIYTKNNFVVNLYLITLLLITTIDLPAPIVIYGSQIILVILSVLLRFLLYPKVSQKSILIAIFIILFIELLASYQISYLKYTEIFWLNTNRTLLWILSAIFLYDFLKKFAINYLFNALNIVILIHACAIFLQIFSYYILGHELDYSIIIGGESVRSLFSLNNINYRPTGLTSEPSIVSGFMAGLLCLKYVLNKKNDFIFLLGVFSILGTFSTLGILISCIILIILYSKNIRNILLGASVLFIGSLFFIDVLKARIELFILGDDGSNNVKLEIFQSFFNDDYVKFFGYGFIGKSPSAPQFYEALYDMTLYFNVFIYWGLVFGGIVFAIILFWLFKGKFSMREKLFLMIVFIKLSGPTLVFFSFFVTLLLAIQGYSKKMEKI